MLPFCKIRPSFAGKSCLNSGVGWGGGSGVPVSVDAVQVVATRVTAGTKDIKMGTDATFLGFLSCFIAISVGLQSLDCCFLSIECCDNGSRF